MSGGGGLLDRVLSSPSVAPAPGSPKQQTRPIGTTPAPAAKEPKEEQPERPKEPEPIDLLAEITLRVEESSDVWVTLHEPGPDQMSIARLPRGSIVLGLSRHRDLQQMIEARHVQWRPWYSGILSGVVHRFGDPPPEPGPRRVALPGALRADEDFRPPILGYHQLLTRLRQQEKELVDEIERRTAAFAELASSRAWEQIASEAFDLLHLERELNGYVARTRLGSVDDTASIPGVRPQIQETLERAEKALYTFFDSVSADLHRVPIESLGLGRRVIAAEHRGGKIVLALFSGGAVEVACL